MSGTSDGHGLAVKPSALADEEVAGVGDLLHLSDASAAGLDGAQRKAIADDIAGRTMLKRAATLEDVGKVAAFADSDHASALTATALNATAGSVVD